MVKIIIADDSATARMFIRRCLEISGLQEGEFLEAANGREVLELIKESMPDIVFTDLNMPEIDGSALLKRIKASPKTFELPVVVITSAGNPAKEKELKDLGAVAVVKKPVSPAMLMPIIEEIIKE